MPDNSKMIKKSKDKELKRSFVQTTRGFFIDVYIEMKKVSWPSKLDMRAGTIAIIAMAGIVGIFLALVDYIFTQATRFLY